MIIFPIIAALFFGVQFIPQKLAENPKAELYNITLIIGVTITSIGTFLFFVLIEGLKPIYFTFIFSFIGGLIWSIGSSLTLVGINNLGMSKTTVILNTISIYSFLFGILFFSESPTILQFI